MPAGVTTAQGVADWLTTLPAGSTADLDGRTFNAEKGGQASDLHGITLTHGTFRRTVTSTDPALQWPNPNPLLWLLRPVGVTVRGVTFQGPNAVGSDGYGTYDQRWEFDAAVRAEGFTDLTLQGLDIAGVWGDGIQLQKGDGFLIEDLLVRSNGRQGVAVLANDGVIRRFDVTSRRAAFDLEPDTSTQAFGNVKVLDGTIRSWLLPVTAGGPGAFNDVEVGRVTIVKGGFPAINAVSSNGGPRARWNVHDVDIQLISNSTPVLKFANSQGSTVHHVYVNIGAGSTSKLGLRATLGSTVAVDTCWFVNALAIEAHDADSTVTVNNCSTTETAPEGW